MTPGQLCNAALHNLRVGPRLGELPHVLQVARRVALAVGESLLQVGGESVDNLRAVALLFLAVEDVPTDRPVGQDELGVDSGGRSLPAGGDPRSVTESRSSGYHEGMPKWLGVGGNPMSAMGSLVITPPPRPASQRP